MCQTNIGDVRTPDLIHPLNAHVSEQIRIALHLLAHSAQVGLGIGGLDAHQTHQASHSLVIDSIALGAQLGCHASNAIKRRSGVLLIEQTHQV
jgi:hypothetical protein